MVGTVLFRQERKAEPQALSIDDMVLNDIDDFIKNNNIFLAPDEVCFSWVTLGSLVAVGSRKCE